jgi:hypothetical protein
LFLDVEASALGEDSYPTEVGWAFLNGGSGSMLIRPAPGWTVEAWERFAEQIPGRRWDELHARGSLRGTWRRG